MSKPWPVDWPRYKQSSELCDMLEGPCSCGAQHQPGEFELVEGALYRYGGPVSSSAIRISEFNELKIENQRLRVRLELGDSKKFVDTVIDFKVIARDILGRTHEFNFRTVASVSKIKETIQTVLGSMALSDLVQTIGDTK